MAAMTVALIAAAAVTVGGLTAYGAYAAADAEQEQADYNAKIAEWQAEQSRITGEAARNRAEAEAIASEADSRRQEELERERNEKLKAMNRARAGAAGLSNEGTPLLWNIDQARTLELNALEVRRQGIMEAQQIRYQGELAAYNAEVDAIGYDAQATSYSNMAANAGRAKYFNSTASFLTAGLSTAGTALNISNHVKEYNQNKTAKTS